MNKKEAKKILEDNFDHPFDESKFTYLVSNLLDGLDLEKSKGWTSGISIYESFRKHISKYKRVGVYTDPDGVLMDVIIVEVKEYNTLNRARTSLRNFIIRHLKHHQYNEKDHAIVAFYSKEDQGKDWRFSFVKLEYKDELNKKGKVKTIEEFTPARRYSFLVGETEKGHTAKKRILDLSQTTYKPTVEQLEEIFNIETITDEFFEQYKSLFLNLKEHLESNSQASKILAKNKIDSSRFAKKLLGQIVFLYFLQKKGWLGVAHNGKWGEGDKRFIQNLYKKAEDNNNFYDDHLKFLFYEALAKDRSHNNPKNFYNRFDCKIPFLNGGLFESEYDDWESTSLEIPNDLFSNEIIIKKTGDIGTGILNVFSRYNFTIREDEPLEKEVAVDPEMLGKVFENLLDIKDRKSKGAFYTPREIVHYMCQESLINYLNNELNNRIENKGISRENIVSLIKEGMFYYENDAKVIEKGKETNDYSFKTPKNIINNAEEIDNFLANIKICDPAIGSGAFPVGLLHEIVNTRLVLNLFTKTNHSAYKLKRHAIENSIYGADIDPSAIDIARLRLWLSMIVDEEDYEDISALPNLDYLLVCGNSLIGVPKDVVRDNKLEDKIILLKQEFINETNEKIKKDKRNIISKEIKRYLEQVSLFTNYKIEFDFQLLFSEVWKEKGGFDIVIGNPPYGLLNKKQNKHIGHIVNNKYANVFKKSLEFAPAKGGVINAFRLFIVKSSHLLGKNKNGVFSQIFPLAFTGDVTSNKLRKYILNNYNIVNIEAFPERDDENKRVFKGAKMSVCILNFINNFTINNDFLLRIHLDKFVNDNSPSLTLNKSIIQNIEPKYLTIPLVKKYDLKIMDKVYSRASRLGLIANCFTGEIDLTLDREYITNNPNDSIMLKGAIIDRYEIRKKMSQGEIEYLNKEKYIKNRTGKRAGHFLTDRIGMQGITGVNEKTRLKMTYIPKNHFCANSVNYISLQNSQELKSYLAQLNSSIHNYIFKLNSTNSNVNGYEVNNLPIITGSDINLVKIVDYLLFLKESKINNLSINFFNELLDALVLEKYFKKEFIDSKKELALYLKDLNFISSDMSDEIKSAIIQSEFNRLYDIEHPIRNTLYYLDTISEVKTIREYLNK